MRRMKSESGSTKGEVTRISNSIRADWEELVNLVCIPCAGAYVTHTETCFTERWDFRTGKRMLFNLRSTDEQRVLGNRAVPL